MRATRFANTALWAAYGPDHARLVGVRDLRAVQARVLRGILARNADSDFGRAHGFGSLRSARAYADAVPLSTWDDYADAVARVAAGEGGVLTSERVRLLEPSSGSTAATKLVPYTAGLRAEFQRGLRPWLHDLYASWPALRRGRSYWSVSPPGAHLDALRASAPPPLPGARPPAIGFDDDADYLGPLAKRLLTAVFAVDADVARAPTMDAFRDRTCLQLLACRDLALVSVWNPTFLTLLLDRIRDHADDLLGRLDARRRAEVAPAVRAADWTAVWPHLTLLSCLADAAAAAPAADLACRLPGVALQPKGLLATEGFVSVPLLAAGGAVLAARSHFFEFVDAAGGVRGAHELEDGGRYAVVLTTSGGLYRYRLGDEVEVTGRFGVLPVLRFRGRADRVSDLVGEKLSEAFVAAALAAAGASGFALLAPERDRYVLYTDAAAPGLAGRVDEALRANFHYDHARRLGQLGAVEVVDAGPHAREAYVAASVANGQRLGDVKPAHLATTGGWARIFGAAGPTLEPSRREAP